MVSSVRGIVGGFFWIAFCVALMPLAGGCGSGPAKVNISGTVVKDGNPLKVSKKGVVEVQFIGESEGERRITKQAEADPETGKFEIKNIPVGKYKISIRQVDPMPATDLLEGAFSRQNSHIFRNVESNDQVIDIDLAKEGAK